MKKQSIPKQHQQVRIVQPENFWTYLPHDKVETAVESYLNTNQKDIFNQQSSGTGFIDHIRLALSQIGGYLHPDLENNPGLQLEQQYLRLANCRIDWCTLKLILTFLQASTISVLCFSNNHLTIEELELVYQMAQSKIVKLFIEFNPLVIPSRVVQFYTIEYLYLRGNNLIDQQLCDLMSKLHNRLKLLELGQNCISKQGCDAIGDYLSKQNTLEHIGLAANNIRNYTDIKHLCSSFGKHKLTVEELASIQDLEVKREEQIAKYTKQKKKFTEEMLIQVPTYTKIDNFHYQFTNPQLISLNLSSNQLPEVDRDHIDKFMNRLVDNFTLILTCNQFENSTKAKLRKKYGKLIMI